MVIARSSLRLFESLLNVLVLKALSATLILRLITLLPSAFMLEILTKYSLLSPCLKLTTFYPLFRALKQVAFVHSVRSD